LADEADVAVEEIPPEDSVSRHIFWPHKFDEVKGVIWQSAFMFSGIDEAESVVWRKYKPQIEDVQALGCEQQSRKKAQSPDARFRYEGAITANVGAIRTISTARGFGFEVRHEPSGGQGRHHAEIRRRRSGDETPKKSDRADLLVSLKNVFGKLEPHSCPAAAT
jgi:hypothetical protein